MGYASKTFSVQITDRQKTILNVPLYNGRLATNFTCDSTIIPVGATIHFIDQSAGHPQTWRWEFEGGSPGVSSNENPSVTYAQPGKFNVKLVITRPGSADSLIRQDYIDVEQWYLMGNQSYTVCDALFYDSGGAGAGYGSNESSVITFLPAQAGKRLKASFLSFDVETSASCQDDYLKAYDGVDTAALIIGTYCGNALPPAMLASNNQGALTFRFKSNAGINGAGWEAALECDSNVGVQKISSVPARIYPNPCTDGYIRIETNSVMNLVEVTDELGHEIARYFPGSDKLLMPCNFQDGLYFFRIQSGDTSHTTRVVIMNKR